MVVAAVGGLEEALAASEEQVDVALKALAAVTRELRKAKTGAARGTVRDLRRALSTATGLAEEALQARGGVPGSAAARNVKLSWQRFFNTRGYGEIPSWRYRLIQVLSGLVVMAGGILLIAVSS